MRRRRTRHCARRLRGRGSCRRAGACVRPGCCVRVALAAVLVILFRGLVGLGAQQRLTVGDRDLVIVGVNFAEGEETVAVAAILDERRLKRRFDAGDPREIDVSF